MESQQIQPPPFSSAKSRTRHHAIGDWAVSALLLVIGLFGLKVSVDGHYWSLLTNEESTGESIGSLLPKALGVRFRQSRSPLWIDLETAPRGLLPGDVIFTSPKSSATMEFSSGGQAEIGPSSLVVVEAPPRSTTENSWLGSLVRLSEKVAKSASPAPVLKIQKGTVQVKVKAKSHPLQIEAAGKRLKISAGERDSSLAIDFDPKKGNEIQLKQEASAPPVKVTAVTQNIDSATKSANPPSGAKPSSVNEAPPNSSFEEREIKIEAGRATSFALSSLPSFTSPPGRSAISESPGPSGSPPSSNGNAQDTSSSTQVAPTHGIDSKLLDEVELSMEPALKEPSARDRNTFPSGSPSGTLAKGQDTSAHLAPPLPALFEKGSTTLERPVLTQNPSMVPMTVTAGQMGVPMLASNAPPLLLQGTSPLTIESPRPAAAPTSTLPLPPADSHPSQPQSLTSQKDEANAERPPGMPQKKSLPTPSRHLAQSSAPKKINPPTQTQTVAYGIELLPTKDLGPEQEELLGSDPQKLKKIPRIPLGEKTKSTQDETDDFLIQIHWKLRTPRAPAAVSTYRLEIAASSGQVLYQAETVTTEHLVVLESMAEASRLNLKVRVTSGGGSSGLESPWVPLQIELAPPRLTQPVNGAREKLGPPVLLTWSRGASSRYQLQISKSPKFSASEVDDEVSENLWVLESEKNKFVSGTYFWRTRRLVELPGSKIQKSPWSRAESFILEEK